MGNDAYADSHDLWLQTTINRGSWNFSSSSFLAYVDKFIFQDFVYITFCLPE